MYYMLMYICTCVCVCVFSLYRWIDTTILNGFGVGILYSVEWGTISIERSLE